MGTLSDTVEGDNIMYGLDSETLPLDQIEE